MAYIVVEDTHGDQQIGSAVHVGEGVFVTARHVVESRRILEVASTTRTYIPLTEDEAASAHVLLGPESQPAYRLDNGRLSIAEGPFFHHDERVDVAAFRVADIDPRTPIAILGSHLDDWLGDDDFTLSEAIV